MRASQNHVLQVQSPGLFEALSFKDEGGLLKDDNVSSTVDVEQGIEIQRPERSREHSTVIGAG